MLEGIIENGYCRPQLGRSRNSSTPTLIGNDWNPWIQSFVYQDLVAAITAKNDCRFGAATNQLGRDPRRERSFAGAADRKISNAYNRYRSCLDVDQRAVIQLLTSIYSESIQSFKWSQGQARRAREQIVAVPHSLDQSQATRSTSSIIALNSGASVAATREVIAATRRDAPYATVIFANGFGITKLSQLESRHARSTHAIIGSIGAFARCAATRAPDAKL